MHEIKKRDLSNVKSFDELTAEEVDEIIEVIEIFKQLEKGSIDEDKLKKVQSAAKSIKQA